MVDSRPKNSTECLFADLIKDSSNYLKQSREHNTDEETIRVENFSDVFQLYSNTIDKANLSLNELRSLVIALIERAKLNEGILDALIAELGINYYHLLTFTENCTHDEVIKYFQSCLEDEI